MRQRTAQFSKCLVAWTIAMLSAAPACRPNDEIGNVAGIRENSAVATPWRHLSLDELDVRVDSFQPVRARYLQVMYDLDGQQEIQSRTAVHLDLDRVIHSGSWDGQLPAVIDPLREPGLLIAWQIQNALYNGFDRVLTDSHLSIKQRVMPGGAGLLVGSMDGAVHTRIAAAPPRNNESVRVDIDTLRSGAVNVLTVPYVLAAMTLNVGDRFTLPGYAMINGPDGGGIQWRGAFRVTSTQTMTVRGHETRVTEVLLNRMDEINGVNIVDLDQLNPGDRVTRILVSPNPPYLLGRANLQMTNDRNYVFVREFLGLVDWAQQPLPLSDYYGADVWDLDLSAGTMNITDSAIPQVLVPLNW